MLNILKNKKTIILIVGILLIPIVIPLLEILINCLLYVGRYAGTWVRVIMESGIC